MKITAKNNFIKSGERCSGGKAQAPQHKAGKTAAPREKLRLSGEARGKGSASKTGAGRLKGLENQALEAESKNLLISGIIMDNGKISPSPGDREKISHDLSLYPEGCLRLIKDAGVKVMVLGEGQSYMDTGLLKEYDYEKYSDPAKLKAIHQLVSKEVENSGLVGQSLCANDLLGLMKLDYACESQTGQDLHIGIYDSQYDVYYYMDLNYAGPYDPCRADYFGKVNDGAPRPLDEKLQDLNDKHFNFPDQEFDQWSKAVKKMNPDPEAAYLLFPDYQLVKVPGDPSAGEEETRRVTMARIHSIHNWDDDDSTYGKYASEDRSIVLKSEGLSRVPSRVVGKSAVHETAHAVDYVMREKDGDYYREFDRLASAKYEDYRDNRKTYLAVSDYAMDCLDEFKAESITALVSNAESRKLLKDLDKEWYVAVKGLVTRAAELGQK